MMVPKFRAWDETQHKMLQVDCIEFIDGKAYWVEASPADGTVQGGNDGSIGDNSQLKLEQYTGLKDANGKDIYEGDILAWHSNIYRKQDWVGLVLYRGAGFAVQESDKSYSSPEWLDCACRKDANIIEVIGNIHENPELLEEENERN
ncbi:YopX family protein [Lentilactobacillus parabuchneri]|uniref:YopX family protein n=1 Tax=Lentilactobacillus parabuchneri TaxID=152331 RepID=UPI0023077FE6|nr:YopX family protein [Lentilactobacillus parabuchneri]MDB1104858.1 YopX family protein [Lentilactobacillus parabuchneri]